MPGRDPDVDRLRDLLLPYRETHLRPPLGIAGQWQLSCERGHQFIVLCVDGCEYGEIRQPILVKTVMFLRRMIQEVAPGRNLFGEKIADAVKRVMDDAELREWRRTGLYELLDYEFNEELVHPPEETVKI
jgi:hypothetical protein